MTRNNAKILIENAQVYKLYKLRLTNAFHRLDKKRIDDGRVRFTMRSHDRIVIYFLLRFRLLSIFQY